MKKQFVIRSINNEDESVCVDTFKREDKTFGFDEFRLDKEKYKGWYKIHSYGYNIYLTELEAYDNACKNIFYLNDKKTNRHLTH